MTKPNPIRVCAACGTEFLKSYSHETYCSFDCMVFSRIAKRGPDECWPWMGSTTAFGYGEFRHRGRPYRVPRVICEHAHGPPPFPDAVAMHSCDNPPCCNPTHMTWGSQSDNSNDMYQKGRHPADYVNGQRVHTAKLTEEDVREIRRRVADGAAIRATARMYGVSQACIHWIVRRKNWKHVA